MDSTFSSGGWRLASYLRQPTGKVDATTGMILCHGFPTNPLDARRSAGTFPEFVDRVTYDLGMPALTFNFRGTGTSEGDFSLQGWVDDLRAAIEHLIGESGVRHVLLVGTNTGGSIALCVAVDDPRVIGTALLGARCDFDDWADHPRRLLDHARELGAIRSLKFPESMDDWSRAFRRFRPLAAASRFAPRPMLVMHGEDDELVPSTDSRQLAESHGAAELNLLPGAGHRLRHDPRAVAILKGWLDRVRD